MRLACNLEGVDNKTVMELTICLLWSFRLAGYNSPTTLIRQWNALFLLVFITDVLHQKLKIKDSPTQTHGVVKLKALLLDICHSNIPVHSTFVDRKEAFIQIKDVLTWYLFGPRLDP